MPRALKLAMLLVPLGAALLVCFDTPFHRLPQGSLSGVEVETPRPALSWTSVWTGKFQPAFEKWLESRLSMKPMLVRTDNSIGLVAFRQISARTGIPIVLGKDDTLFEMNYINNANHVSQFKGDPPPPSPYSTEEAARRLGRAARAFRRLGIDFVLVLYPHKAWMQPERVPKRWTLPGGRVAAAEGLASLRSALRDNGVPLVDGVEVLTELQRRAPGLPLYNRGGTHWTDAAACAVAQLLVQRVSPRTPLECTLGRLELAHGVDMDLAELINVWGSSRFRDLVAQVTPSLAVPLPDGPRPAVIIGTSFSQHLLRLLTEAGFIRDGLRVSYYRSAQADGFDWQRVQGTRLIIFEQSQWSFVTINLTDFLDSLERRVPRFAEALREEP